MGNIDAKPRKPLNIWTPPDPNWGPRSGQLNFHYVHGITVPPLAMRLLPRLCYQCFLTHGHKKTALVRDIVKRLDRNLIDQKPSKQVLSIDRQRDLLAMMVHMVNHRYGMGRKNVEWSDNISRAKCVSKFWQASTVYRHLRKKYRIKGMVCKVVSDMEEYSTIDLFDAPRVIAPIEHSIMVIRAIGL